MSELFAYEFFRHALAASVLTALTCGLIGTWIVSRRMVFLSGGIGHASFGGIGLGYYLGFDPVLGALGFAVLAGFLFERIRKVSGLRRDSLIGVIWSFGMALGVIFIYLTPGYAPDLMSYLFGSILTVSGADLLRLLFLSAGVLLFFIFFFRSILAVSFDSEYARLQGIRVEWINSLLLVLTSLTIVLNIRVMGIILVISLLTIPQATAELFTRNFRKLLILSSFFAFLSSLSGLIFSWILDVPSGASIIFFSVILNIACRGVLLLKKPKTGT